MKAEPNHTANPESVIFNEVQLLLAEKRTALAALRTGIAVFALPLSVFSFLIVTSRNYDVIHVLHLFVPLVAMNLFLVVLGGYLIFRSIIRLRHYDHMILGLKARNAKLSEFIE